MGIAEGFEERACEREHLGRRGAGASHQAMRKCHENEGLAGISPVNCAKEYYICIQQ